MIFKGSRYENTGTYQTIDSTGQTVSALKIRFISPAPAGYYHTFTADQRLDSSLRLLPQLRKILVDRGRQHGNGSGGFARTGGSY